MKKNDAPWSDDEPVDPSAAHSKCPAGPAVRTDDRQKWGEYQFEQDDRTPEEAGYGYGV